MPLTYKEVTANPPLEENEFVPNEAIKDRAKAPVNGNVPYQCLN